VHPFPQNKNCARSPSSRTFITSTSVPTPASADPPSNLTPSPTHLLDAYCAAFALLLAPHFAKVATIELSADSICFVMHNVEIDGFVHKVSFRSGDALLVVVRYYKGCDAFA
ncbi:hypothetical protein EDB87DRAFT_1597025, partial [Lactarius vividus]